MLLPLMLLQWKFGPTPSHCFWLLRRQLLLLMVLMFICSTLLHIPLLQQILWNVLQVGSSVLYLLRLHAAADLGDNLLALVHRRDDVDMQLHGQLLQGLVSNLRTSKCLLLQHASSRAPALPTKDVICLADHDVTC